MGAQPTPVVKSWILRKMDTRFKTLANQPPDEQALETATKGQPSATVEAALLHRANQEGFVPTADVLAHVLEVLQMWWPGVANKAEIIAAGYAFALNAAAGKKPIESFWIPNHTDFEIVVAESDQQVTLFLMTPQPMAATSVPAGAGMQENLWLIATDTRVAAIKAMFPPGDPSYAFESSKDPFAPLTPKPAGIIAQRLVSY